MVWSGIENGFEWYADMLRIVLFPPSELNEYDPDKVEKFKRVFEGLSQYSFEA
jgi:hypothetical protein